MLQDRRAHTITLTNSCPSGGGLPLPTLYPLTSRSSNGSSSAHPIPFIVTSASGPMCHVCSFVLFILSSYSEVMRGLLSGNARNTILFTIFCTHTYIYIDIYLYLSSFWLSLMEQYSFTAHIRSLKLHSIVEVVVPANLSKCG